MLVCYICHMSYYSKAANYLSSEVISMLLLIMYILCIFTVGSQCIIGPHRFESANYWQRGCGAAPLAPSVGPATSPEHSAHPQPCAHRAPLGCTLPASIVSAIFNGIRPTWPADLQRLAPPAIGGRQTTPSRYRGRPARGHYRASR